MRQRRSRRAAKQEKAEEIICYKHGRGNYASPYPEHYCELCRWEAAGYTVMVEPSLEQ